MADSADRSGQAREPRVVRILMRLLAFVLILAAILFLTAGRWDWLMGWLYLALYACVTVVAVLVVPLDPELTKLNKSDMMLMELTLPALDVQPNQRVTPMALWESVLILVITSLLGILSFYGLRPHLEQAGWNQYTAYLFSLSIVFMVMLVWSVLAFLWEGRGRMWKFPSWRTRRAVSKSPSLRRKNLSLRGARPWRQSNPQLASRGPLRSTRDGSLLAAFLRRTRMNRLSPGVLVWSLGLGFLMLASTLISSPLLARAISGGLLPIPQGIPDYVNPLKQLSIAQVKAQLVAQGVLPLIPIVLLLNIFGEEIFWRGMVFPRQELRHGDRTFLIHGTFWAFSHLFQYWLMLPILISSVALAYVYQRTRNTWAGILAHMLNNALPLVIMAFAI